MTQTTPDSIEIRPTGPLRASIRPPGSKSITNRALVCAALARGESQLTGALDSEDTQVLVESLRRLRIGVDVDAARRTIAVHGCNGQIPAASADLFVGNSGTTVRFLTAMAALGHGVYRLDGTPRMRERPIADLLTTLGQLGANVASELETGCPPVVVRGDGLPGGRATVRGDVSSQFLSALLMAAPYARCDVDLRIDGPLVSQPYIRMTLAVMSAFGVDVESRSTTPTANPQSAIRNPQSDPSPPAPLPQGERGESYDHFHIPAPRHYVGREYAIEPDASAASYFFGAAAIAGGEVTVLGLSRESLQGDVAFVDVLARMGCQVRSSTEGITVAGGPLRGVEVDMNAISDTVQTLAAVALFANGPTTVTNVAHVRHKETDRLAALATELRKLGADVEERPDGLRITPRPLHGAALDTYDDHRMAMSLALVGLRTPGVVIRDPGCTRKTYPDFFDDLAKLTKNDVR